VGRYGLRIGVYLASADEKRYLHGVYADGGPRAPRAIPALTACGRRAPGRFWTPGAADYDAHMLNTLYERLTSYGLGAAGRGVRPGRVAR